MTGTPEFVSLTEDQFDETYRPINTDDHNSTWEYEQVKDKPTENVWSVVEVDDSLYAIPGWHVVNVIGYNVTEVPWPHENIEAHLHTFESDPDEDDDNDDKDDDA